MRTLSLFIHDDRYSAPTINFVLCRPDDDGYDHAADLLKDSPHHVVVEVFFEDECLLRLERDEVVGASPGRGRSDPNVGA